VRFFRLCDVVKIFEHDFDSLWIDFFFILRLSISGKVGGIGL
jgi:hypothetical protein